MSDKDRSCLNCRWYEPVGEVQIDGVGTECGKCMAPIPYWAVVLSRTVGWGFLDHAANCDLYEPKASGSDDSQRGQP